MSNDSSNSQTDPLLTKMTTEVEQLKESVKKYYDFERLAVLMIGGGEQLVGEVDGIGDLGSEKQDPSMIVGIPVLIKNPKRYMRLQKVNQQGTAVTVDYFIGALDGIDHDGSVMQVVSMAAYWVRHLGIPSQINFLKILDGFFKQKMIAKAMASGLALPGHMTGGIGGKG